MRNFLATFVAIISLAFPQVAGATDRELAVASAQNIMQALGDKNFSHLWDSLTSDWFKQQVGGKQGFVANMSIQRQVIGSLIETTVLEVAHFNRDPISGLSADIYQVTFHNRYSNFNAYEFIVVIEENGEYKMSGFNGTAAP
ncbi:hypothetical protein [Sinorhizobium meliloti]|uniref:hypothetical protein n=1 Tax=Rhizobium meliloti TaxID=382 RepID=UPI00299D0157|nr:hypothetical protein [Sinorhizobium meliloti]